MLFDWYEYQKVARQLGAQASAHIENGTAETNAEVQALMRATISRAYYAAFNKALLWAAKEDPSLISLEGQAHAAVIKHCKNHKKTPIKEVGQSLAEIRRFRSECDYQAYALQKNATVQAILKDVDTIFKILKAN